MKTMNVDARVLKDWEQTVHECIEEKVRSLIQKHVSKCVLKSKILVVEIKMSARNII